MTDNKTLIVVGMHRSGTSLTAQWLYRCGLNLGDDLIGADAGNPDGHFEDKDFLQFHLSLLRHNQIEPHYQTSMQAVPVNTYFEAKARHLVQLKNELHTQWGWKEPRTCLFLPFWHRYIPNARYVIVYRHYTEVVDSLMRRYIRQFPDHIQTPEQRVEKELSFLRVWVCYTTHILHFLETIPSASYSVHSLYNLLDEDTLLFSHLTDTWGFELTYQPIRSIYKDALLTRNPLTLPSTEVVEMADWLYTYLEKTRLANHFLQPLS